MNVVRGALWVNDLAQLPPQAQRVGSYALGEVDDGVRTAHLVAVAGLPPGEVEARLAGGCRVFAAWHWPSGQLSAWTWVSTGEQWVTVTQLTYRFADDECYGWNADVLPEHRGHALFTAVLRFAGRRMNEHGCRFMWAGALDSKLDSQRSLAAAGFRPILHHDVYLDPPPTRLRLRCVEYADPRMADRAHSIIELPAQVTVFAAS